MKITKELAKKLVGMEFKKAAFILDKLAGTSFDYPEMRIEELSEIYDDLKRK